MAVFKGSRYENSDIVRIVDSNNVARSYVPRGDALRPVDLENNYFIHQKKETQELDAISYGFGYPPTKWWVIGEVNQIFFGFDIANGTQVSVPETDLMSNPIRRV